MRGSMLGSVALVGLAACLKPQPGQVAGADDLTLTERNNLVANATFDGGRSLPWTSSFTLPGRGEAAVRDGAFCLTVEEAGKNNWDAQLRHRQMTIERGHRYIVSFQAWADRPTKIRPKVGMAGPPYAEYWYEVIELTSEPQTVRGSFRMSADTDSTAELALHAGGPLATAETPFTLCIDDVWLADPQFDRPAVAEAMPVPDVRVNQVAYLPALPKVATLRSDAKEPVEWQLLGPDGEVVADGQTRVHGDDPASGEHVHLIDFSDYRTPGRGLRLRAGDAESHPFDIDAGVYGKLKYDALAYFYHNRSGIEIEMPYAGDERWTRPAGHSSDSSVPCAPGTCDYELDVSRGWYDAGDHGKYVVNGGISVWTLMNLWERAQHLGESSADFGDGKLQIPEARNRVPDLLDEVRWEMHFMLGMQVPPGKPLAGMAHHKMHDERWTELGTAPHEDPMKRYLQPPSTAATLNLAATGAQCARVFRPVDRKLAARCLRAAERAWQAARKHPRRYAPEHDVGGGPYDDKDVSDEFYWAAAELFITTGNPTYQEAMQRSPYHLTMPSRMRGTSGESGMMTAMTWQATDALGVISLATVPNQLSDKDVAQARASIEWAADHFVEVMKGEGYRLPLAPGPGNEYPWGSNSLVLNNLVVIALAYDFSNERRYLEAVTTGMDYLLGRNPLDRSYITGYGERPVANPHHRFWARQADPSYPPPIAGAVSGGPNSGLEDPYARGAGLAGCAPQTCFLDHIESWSTNEITINWNAPLAWVAAFLDEHAR